MFRSFLISALAVVLLSSCGGPASSPSPTSPAHTSTSHLVMTAHTPTQGDRGDFFIRGDIEDGEVSIGDTIDIAEPSGRSISLRVKSLSDSAGEYPKAVKGQRVSVYFDGDKSLYDTVSMDAYLVEKGGKYPVSQNNTPEVKVANLALKGKINGQDWEGKSMMNPPPYYKYGSRAMMSPDTPIFKMSFWQDKDSSSVNFDLKGGLKVGTYAGNNLYINFSGNKGTIESHNTDSDKPDVRVEVTSYTENGNTATISGKISGTLSDRDRGTVTLDLEWKDAKIDVWGMEAK